MATLDVSIFKKKQISDCISGDYAGCDAVNRLIIMLKYYATLNVKDDENDREIFRSFAKQIHVQIVDDYNHFMKIHNDQLNKICDMLMNGKKCKMKECYASKRHFKSEKHLNIDNDHTMNFYVNLMDSLHFIICHCYDCGMRVKQNENEQKQNGDDDNSLFDAEFARLNTIIRKSDFETEAFERISNESCSKFRISKQEQGDRTFLDELYKHIRTESMFGEVLKVVVAKSFMTPIA